MPGKHCLDFDPWFVQNAFSTRLGPLDLEHYPLFVVDFLHEIELGMWKAIFTHLIRLLYAHNPNNVHELNKRCVPSIIVLRVLTMAPLFDIADTARYLHLVETQSDVSPMMSLK